MKKIALIALLGLLAMPAFAQEAPTPADQAIDNSSSLNVVGSSDGTAAKPVMHARHHKNAHKAKHKHKKHSKKHKRRKH